MDNFNPPEIICRTCGSILPKTKRSDAVYCDYNCQQKYLRSKNREKDLPRRRAKRAENPLVSRLARSKHEAKKRGIPFNLCLEDLGKVPDECPVLGIPLVWNLGIGRKGYHPNSPSLDRIVPSKGYTKGNVRIISARANLLKNDATIAELEAVLADLKTLLGYN